MDPLSVAASIAGIVSLCSGVIAGLDHVRTKSKQAQMTGRSLASQCAAVRSGLETLEEALKERRAVAGTLNETGLLPTIERAAEDCRTVLSSLQSLVAPPGEASRMRRLQRRVGMGGVTWNEDKMKQFSQFFHEQLAVLSFLIGLLTLVSLEPIVEIGRRLQEKESLLKDQASEAESLSAEQPWRSNEATLPGDTVEYPQSIFIIAVDFGTTWTKVSYAARLPGSDVDNVRQVVNWPGGCGFGVPSQIAYGGDGGNRVTWGYETDGESTTYCWTKLLLQDPDRRRAEPDDGLARSYYGDGFINLPPGKTPQEVIRDFLAEVNKTVVEEISFDLGRHVLSSMIPSHCCFTVPAHWPLSVQLDLVDAARSAGFAANSSDAIYLLPEAEAAAISCITESLRTRGGEDPGVCRPGDCVLVCDCGGGTVDLVTYRVEAVEPNVKLSHTYIVTGSNIGSTSIDRAFHRLMSRRFGEAFANLPSALKGPNSSPMAAFQAIKHSFSESQADQVRVVPLPLDVPKSDYYRDSEVLLSTEDMRSLFAPVIADIIAHLDEQITMTRRQHSLTVNTIILSGGFSMSPYLFERIKAWVPPNTRLARSARCWTDVSRGAVIKTHQRVDVTDKRCNLHLGIPFIREFADGLDNDDDPCVIDMRGYKVIKDVEWLLHPGQRVTPDTIVIKRVRWEWAEGSSTERTLQLVESRATIAPEKLCNPSVFVVGTINIKFSDVDFNIYKTKTTPSHGGRRDVYHVEFDVEVTVTDEFGHLRVQSMMQGKRIGQTELAICKDWFQNFHDDGEN